MPPVLTALVTAGSAGLGAATAKLFARNGYNVVINYANDADRAAALVRELRSLSPLPADQQRFGAVKADLSNRLETPGLVRQAVEVLGGTGLDVVFSNGGWTRLRDIADLDDNVDEDDWDRCFNMNVKSHLFLMHAARPYLDEAEGVFITTASLAGVKVSGSSLAYAVTKAAQLHLVKGLAIAAGPKDWGLQFPEEKQQAARDRTPLKRLATVEDVAEQVLCFARSRSVTGANAVIDGGLSI
ncbi:Short-chain dehydrogenase [Colletotrichum higginsianum IMI 349063]|uniref:Short-chain dehydrogenase n=1 Tax=Colletotrichum higginsianum (strain IMI 349063) TaxID=759273 RepID=A0A1B7YTI2_COLHI|nr:Short-chain dehydrogenase [Colletotrichum higginsianum IMI 349063]OBR15323.1 Short-chain dehydrogenase [Colletotrichum higginsianum IMI 349063]GJC92404.1 short-chain dehydrogenase [Colletotrichum higginsianum]